MDIMYNPEDVGKEVMNSHGKLSKIRKYHMTTEEQQLNRQKWEEDIKDVNYLIKKKAGLYFYNPYRKGVYYYQLYSMFLLGCNEYHSLNDIINKMEEILSCRMTRSRGSNMSEWEKFSHKSSREDACRCKDFVGRIQENMTFFQRLTKFHPTGYKLRQVFSAVDMKRISKVGFVHGLFFYRLSTYRNIDKAFPIRDYREFDFPRHRSKYVNKKFVGKILTKPERKKKNVVSSMQSK